MKSGDMVLFRTNGNSELKSGTLRQGLFGSLFVSGMDECVYGFSSLEMIQIYPGGERAWIKNYNIPRGYACTILSGACRN